MFTQNILECIKHSLFTYANRNAFFIKGEYYTYGQLANTVAAIRDAIHARAPQNKCVGLVIEDELETYASIIALWMDGMCYVPLHPEWPLERCEGIIDQVGIDLVLDSGEKTRYHKVDVLESKRIENKALCQNTDYIKDIPDTDLAYILFTSGSTGVPKGVPISRGNLSAFVEAFWDMGFDITEEDRVLQCFDLSFDLSVMSYLIPLLRGACAYTVPYNEVKYTYSYTLMEDYELTVALMAPSTITYLKPYFDEINLPKLRYSLFCGEALYEDITLEWAKCIPNAAIFNVYGPTEDTIFCTYYQVNRNGVNKTHNGVLSIGKTMSSGCVTVLNEQGEEAGCEEQGELGLFGHQLFTEYWKNHEKTRDSFIVAADGKKYYKSGDVCYRDSDGDIMYCGRKDHQVKIQGFRVELGEIEFHANQHLGKKTVCIAYDNAYSLTEIALFVESVETDTKDLYEYLKSQMPDYMIPSKILFCEKFPLNINGKIDRKVLKNML